MKAGMFFSILKPPLNVVLIVVFLCHCQGANEEKIKKNLLEGREGYWDILQKSANNGTIKKGFYFNDNGVFKIYAYNDKFLSRYQLKADDLPYDEKYSIAAPSTLKIAGSVYRIVKITADTLIISNLKAGEDVILIKNRDKRIKDNFGLNSSR